MTPLRHEASGRSTRALVVLLTVWTGALLLWTLLEASAWIVGALMLASLPAAVDFAKGRKAGLVLDDTQLRWWSGRATGEVALNRLERVRFETRLDLSVRVRLVIEGGRRLTLPPDSLPPHPRLQEALDARGIRTERHHFSLL
ncbi:hypothetical protein [Maliponia aquimaris]|uniref:DUF2244 domain-containing protein n=1 Tax=Maliponia aquimaris TaxID=1673631 RepID=A0A238L801_9RHOB|nr:hypothetical protein [Maliponia aquimaris]SMX50502.1 hypothetical protein MAA8898_04816 [Maliponia aquimaris]